MALSAVAEATRSYERWLRRQVPTVEGDFRRKHRLLADAPFSFLRGTFYRWIQAWPSVCGDLDRATRVAAVGDLHVANFGTWRDQEGRLAWGVNDFDEAHVLPFTADLVRLAASALVAIRGGHLTIAPATALARILDGYRSALEAGGHPFILEERHHALRDLALSELRDPARFWARLPHGREVKGDLPRGARKALERLLPDDVADYKIFRRIAGIGSLGRVRLVAVADWRGALIAREAKARAVSACIWAGAKPDGAVDTILERACRPHDPLYAVRRRWIVRRLSPDCSRIELESLRKTRDEKRVLRAMGAETANIHLASRRSDAIARDLDRYRGRWLARAAGAMVDFTDRDYRDWCRAR